VLLCKGKEVEMLNEKDNTIVSAASPWLILQWILNHEVWRLGIGEDPHWGDAANQITLLTTIHGLASRIADPSLKTTIQSAAADGLVNSSKQMANKTVHE